MADLINIPEVFFTAEDLSQFNGLNGKPIYLSVMGIVYDVTPGEDFYAVGKAYGCFAGKEVSRCLAKMEINDNEANAGWVNLNEEHAKTMLEWKAKYDTKYKIMGRFAPDAYYEQRGVMFGE
eukprot:GILI01007863.1.p3 GENE.GILI01007863.1~~GILI01007863.1.p3  ORF type:complete len:122 (-),score=31.98 GILI01007863.1:349-714(-)